MFIRMRLGDLIFVILLSILFSQSLSANWQFQVELGQSRAQLAKDNIISYNNAPNYYELYRAGGKQKALQYGIIGFYTYLNKASYHSSVGVGAYQFGNFDINGQIFPLGMTGVAAYNYGYKIHSLALLPQLQFSYDLSPRFSLSAKVLLGLASTHAGNYNAAQAPESVYANSPLLFKNKTTTNFCYGVGIAEWFKLQSRWAVGLQYQWINLGMANLGSGSAGENSSPALQAKPLITQTTNLAVQYLF